MITVVQENKVQNNDSLWGNHLNLNYHTWLMYVSLNNINLWKMIFMGGNWWYNWFWEKEVIKDTLYGIAQSTILKVYKKVDYKTKTWFLVHVIWKIIITPTTCSWLKAFSNQLYSVFVYIANLLIFIFSFYRVEERDVLRDGRSPSNSTHGMICLTCRIPMPRMIL